MNDDLGIELARAGAALSRAYDLAPGAWRDLISGLLDAVGAVEELMGVLSTTARRFC